MPQHTDTSTWGSTGTDVAFKDPFSTVTTNIRKKLIFFSSLSILNNYFQIDLTGSHILGINFTGNNIPALSGLLGLVVLYFLISLSIYTFQEFKAWLSQSRLLEFTAHKEALYKLHEINTSSHENIKSALQQMLMHKHRDFNPDDDKELNVHQQSFINIVKNIEGVDVQFEKELNKIQDKFNYSFSAYKAALFSQFIKIGILEVLLPFSIALVAMVFSCKGIVSIINVVF